MKKSGLFCAALLLALLLCACGGGGGEIPDLTGHWEQDPGDAAFYQVADITDDTIRVSWHLVEDGSEHLYWIGSFVPPDQPGASYKWVSENRIGEEYHKSAWARHEDTLTFTYKDGTLNYVTFMGNLKMGVSLEKKEVAG